MKFHFEKVVLWLNNGTKRELIFLPNKINVITGDSSTGKTAVLEIIDYCLFSNRPKISQSIINENVTWYGIKFVINDKTYTIARKSPIGNQGVAYYYFSSTGEIPDQPIINNEESIIKEILEVEFSIDRNSKISYGGKALKADSKISLRYFLLFTTISQDIITDTETFFDKQNRPRYREALERIFDVAVGIDTIDNILKKGEKEELSKELIYLRHKGEKIAQKQTEFYNELAEIIKRAKEYGLIEADSNINESISQLKKIVKDYITKLHSNDSTEYENIQNEIRSLQRKIFNLNRFTKEYAVYRKNLTYTEDNLKPIEYLKEKNGDILKTSIFYDILNTFENDLKKIRNAIKSDIPINYKIPDLIQKHEEKIKDLNEKALLFPDELHFFDNDKAKYIFLGELKAKYELYYEEEHENKSDINDKVERLISEIDSIHIKDTSESKDVFVKVLEENILDYIKFTDEALGNYAGFYPLFSYKDKKLQLRPPKSELAETVGSSSNHMFMHLFLFLGIHEIILRNNVPYIPSYLIIDQPSRPYYGDNQDKEENISTTDKFKMKTVLKLLDNFIQIATKLDKEFQIILFEHVPPEYWDGLENVCLVDKEFRNGNALIPNSMIQNP